ncbi:hypothetical protein QR680_013670 [Steinernema hermaphroditum]|uniref:Uncharacterized protein n=1 Tax=Steinernema hermaphroditum TaxID=289476 RepID=A0AA39I6A3_9BILA|nr:hypothetical protein QR680_013670 [Steinernema hermaphroditum]
MYCYRRRLLFVFFLVAASLFTWLSICWRTVQHQNFVPPVTYRAPLKGYLIIDTVYLECLQKEKSCSNSKVQVVDFGSRRLAAPSRFVAHTGVDDPKKDYFLLHINGTKHAIRN